MSQIPPQRPPQGQPAAPPQRLPPGQLQDPTPAIHPAQQSPYTSPQHAGQMPVAPAGGDATGGLIPYKNMPALMAYYFGIFSLLPAIGLVTALPALVLGFIGLRVKRKNPAAKGTAHAIVGIVLGGIMLFVWTGLIAMFFVSLNNF